MLYYIYCSAAYVSWDGMLVIVLLNISFVTGLCHQITNVMAGRNIMTLCQMNHDLSVV